jgi:hypothetical protein
MKYAVMFVFAFALALTQMGCPGDGTDGWSGCGCYLSDTANVVDGTLHCCPTSKGTPYYCSANGMCYANEGDAQSVNDGQCIQADSVEYCDESNSSAITVRSSEKAVCSADSCGTVAPFSGSK